jgi:polysaccharide deacetylase 2 family uncharacterized protein YibQ
MTTATDDFYAPLKAPAPKRNALDLGLLPALAFTAAALVAIVIAVIVTYDARGGMPRVVVAIPDISAAAAERQRLAEREGAQAPEAMIEPTPAPRRENTVRILTPGGPNGGMQVRDVEVPETRSQGLRPAPDQRLVDKVQHGLVPRIAPDGTRPSRFYARPVPRPPGPAVSRPRVAILIGGLGLSVNNTNDAIARLPGEVTFAFTPYGTNSQALVNRARADGHEVMLQLPMEPFDFPTNDPGPQTLLTSLAPDANIDRLHWSMSRFAGFTGVTNHMGARFTANAAAMRPILADLRARGLTILDDGSSPRSLVVDVAREIGLAHARAHITLDAVARPESIDDALAKLEAEAMRTGQAIGVASALHVSIERIVRWTRELDRRGVTLVPVSALVIGER